jgi:hypothetical protein
MIRYERLLSFAVPLMLLFFFVGCGGGSTRAGSSTPVPPSDSNPVPTLSSLSPAAALPGTTGFT